MPTHGPGWVSLIEGEPGNAIYLLDSWTSTWAVSTIANPWSHKSNSKTCSFAATWRRAPPFAKQGCGIDPLLASDILREEKHGRAQGFAASGANEPRRDRGERIVGGDPHRTPCHAEPCAVDDKVRGDGDSVVREVLHMSGELDWLPVSSCLQGALADQRTFVENCRLGNSEDNHRMVLGIEEVRRTQVLVPLLVLRGQGRRIKRQSSGQAPFRSGSALTGDLLELTSYGDRPPEVLDGELDIGRLRIQRPAASGGSSTQESEPITLIIHEREVTRLPAPPGEHSHPPACPRRIGSRPRIGLWNSGAHVTRPSSSESKPKSGGPMEVTPRPEWRRRASA